jgi:uncharacterized protein YyaL (SSP411 family)
MENTLSEAKSSYLLQHKDNLVAWQIWSENTLAIAEKTSKPLFISIGYSSCHWCHVMAHESFDDEETAEILNKYFIPVKIDREEYPDIDRYYQSFLQATKQQGGWPLSVFAFPDGKPFYGGTYFPKKSAYGIPAFKDLINKISEIYTNERDKLLDITKGFDKYNLQISEVEYKKDSIKKLNKNNIIDLFKQVIDLDKGGLKGKAKFPNVPVLLFLLEKSFDDNQIKDFLIKTADELCFSGIYDHIEGGFFRYSVDENWNVPHFEKMLYDNALNSLFLTKLFDMTDDPKYLYFARRTLDFIIEEFSNEFGLSASMDADSFNDNNELSEGYYYKIFDSDVSDLKENESELFSKKAVFNENTLRFNDISYEDYLKLNEVFSKIAESRQKNKIKPFKDNKVIAGWNMLFCYTLLEFSEVAAEDYYYNYAVELFYKLRTSLLAGGDVYRINYDGMAFKHKTLEDSAYTLFVLTKFYELTREKEFLKLAEKIIKGTLKNFYKDGILYLDKDKKVIDSFDEAVFSAFSIFIKSAIYFKDFSDIDIPDELLDFSADRLMKYAIGHPTLLNVFLD